MAVDMMNAVKKVFPGLETKVLECYDTTDTQHTCSSTQVQLLLNKKNKKVKELHYVLMSDSLKVDSPKKVVSIDYNLANSYFIL